MGIRAASLLVALGVALSASLAGRQQESARALAEAFVEAVNRGDRSALEVLVHPRVASFVREQHPERWEQVLNGWEETRFEPGYEVVVREASEVELYDVESQSLIFGERLRLHFPLLPPSHFLIIRNPGESEADGRASVGSNVVEATRQDDGRWYLTLPLVEIVPD